MLANLKLFCRVAIVRNKGLWDKLNVRLMPLWAAAASTLPEGTLPMETAATGKAQVASTVANAASGSGSEALASAANTVPSIAATSAPVSSVSQLQPMGLGASFSWGNYLVGIGMMFALLAVFWFGARFLKQRGGLRLFGLSGDIQLESKCSLGPKKNLLVVRYGQKRLLLGVTEHHISKLMESSIDEDELDQAIESQPNSNQTGGIFEKLLASKKKDVEQQV